MHVFRKPEGEKDEIRRKSKREELSSMLWGGHIRDKSKNGLWVCLMVLSAVSCLHQLSCVDLIRGCKSSTGSVGVSECRRECGAWMFSCRAAWRAAQPQNGTKAGCLEKKLWSWSRISYASSVVVRRVCRYRLPGWCCVFLWYQSPFGVDSGGIVAASFGLLQCVSKVGGGGETWGRDQV